LPFYTSQIYVIIQLVKLGGILKFKPRRVLPLRRTKLDKAKKKKIILYCIGGFFGLIVLMFLWNLKDLPTPAKLAQLHATQSTKILDRNGSVLYATGDEKRTSIEKKDIPKTIKDATISAEDANFYRHGGVDFKGIARAAVNDILKLKLSQGGSTITQQFVKNAILTNQKTFTRKIKEVILSIEIEQLYNKEDILAMYLNEIPYGGNIYGIQEASRQFFGKDAKDLTLSESATLASIPRIPTYYSPYGTHTDKLFIRKNYVLDRMAELGYISKAEADKAKTEAPTKENPNFTARKDSILAPHFVMYVKEKLADQYGEKVVDGGGLKVTTTLDLEKQKKAQEAVDSGSDKYKKYGATNAALVSVDVKTGEVLAMVGGQDYFDIKNGGNVNVADSARQPGSSFKPIVYAAAFKQQRYSPSFNLFDVRTDFNGYVPTNYDGSTHGPVTMRTALSNSLNIPAVKTLGLVGIPEAIKTAKDLGITTLTQPERYGLSLVLGGAEVKPIEMAGAFAAFGDSGTYHQPISILKVEDSRGKLLYEAKPNENKSQAVDPQVAYEISNVLDDDGARQMVFGSNNALDFGDQHVAAKTGTTSDFHDAWTVGYSTKIATAVWVGNNDNTKMKGGADGSVIAAPIFHNYMKNFLDDSDFNRPEGIKELTVEKFSNKLPSEYSRDLVKDIFASWQIPTDKDDINVVMRVNKTNNRIANDSTPAELVEEKLFANLHNEWGSAWKKYMNWEGPVRSWAEGSGLLLPPTEEDSSYTKRPEISFATPTGGSLSGKVNVAVNINSDKNISLVSYYLGDTEVASSNSNPFNSSFDSSKYPNGSYKLTAKLTDENGVTNQASVQVTISNNNGAKISAVSVSNIIATSAKISFSTDKPASTTVFYGLSAATLSQSKTSGSMVIAHSAVLDGLVAATKYFYRITALTSDGSTSSLDGNFTTP